MVKSLVQLFTRHLRAVCYVFGVILPIVIKRGRKAVIFAKYSGIGDIICTIPAALELKKRHPGAEFVYNCHADFACLPRLGGVTTHVTSMPHIGLIGHWYGFLLAGFYQFASNDDNPEAVSTDVYIREFGEPFGLALQDEHPRLHNHPSTLQRVDDLLQESGISAETMVVIHPGPSWRVREWPRSAWEALLPGLGGSSMASAVQVGTTQHLTSGESENCAVPGARSLVDRLTLEETIALISRATLFIGIDSGLLHIAAAVQTPGVGLWGPTSPQFRFSKHYAKHFVVADVGCQGCHHRFPRLHWVTNCPFNIACMKSITAQDVLQACVTARGSIE